MPVPKVADAKSRLGVLSRTRPHDADALADARRTLTAAKLAKAIEAAITALPPLTDAQRLELVRLLRPTSTAKRRAS